MATLLSPRAPATDPAIIFEAIVKQLAIAATYNRGEVTLAPHIAFTKHGEMFVDAVTLERDGKPPKETKLGTFKLDGLNAIRLTPRRFTPSGLFNPASERYAGNALIAVEA